jgi:hypothetical protein
MMYVIVVDILALILIAAGIALAARRPRRPDGARNAGDGQSGIYARRIIGTMLAAFGLALGLMVTVFHFASGG